MKLRKVRLFDGKYSFIETYVFNETVIPENVDEDSQITFDYGYLIGNILKVFVTPDECINSWFNDNERYDDYD